MPKKELTTQRDIDDAYRSICEILNEICIDDIKHLLECCYEARNKERDLDVDISESEEEEDNDYKEIDEKSEISEIDYDYETTMEDIDNETRFT